MNIIEAAKEMEAGKKVKRRGWTICKYIEKKNPMKLTNEITIGSQFKIKRTLPYNLMGWQFDNEDFLAEDWEVVI
jgi:hypothetical protein